MVRQYQPNHERRKLELIQIYCRLAHDAHYRAEATQLAHLGAVVAGGATIAADFWFAIGDMYRMINIANGTDPALRNPAYLPKPCFPDNVKAAQ